MSGPQDGFPPYYPYYQPLEGGITPRDETYAPSFYQHHSVPPDYIPQPFTPVDEYHSSYAPGQPTSKARRRVGLGGEHVKHRRTRSGCYTCRNRRVKCDEMRPVCDRCRKGSRDCVYPEPVSASKAKRRDSKDSKLHLAESGSSPDGEDADATFEEEDDTTMPSTQDPADRRGSESDRRMRPSASRNNSSTPSFTQAKSPTYSVARTASDLIDTPEALSPATEQFSGLGQEPTLLPNQHRKWAELPRELRFYIDYFRANVDTFHYFFKYDTGDWLHTTFVEMALGYEPLLFAVVGFATYHYSVKRKGGNVHDFLGYYNRSVKLLRHSLTKQSKPTIPTLVTILQLATIEEYLGDWVSLLNHQRAAFQILSTIYTPETALQTETSRKVLGWYLRFDVAGAMLSGSSTFLSRDWYEIRRDYYRQLAQEQPTDLQVLYLDRASEMSLICADAATLWARKGRCEVSDAEFDERTDDLGKRLAQYGADFSPPILDASKFISDFSGAPPRDPNDIVDPYDPNFLYGEPIWLSNLMLLDWWACDLMFKHQLSSMRRQPAPDDVHVLAFKMLKMFEAIELCPNKPPGLLVASQASLAVACLFLPKDERHSMWVRRKLATIEAAGFTYPKMLRQKMSDHWAVDLSHWWLPNDEGFPPILRAIRSLLHDRDEVPQRDHMSAAIRDMRGIFSVLALDEGGGSSSGAASASSPASAATTQTDDKGKSRSSSVQEPRGIVVPMTDG